MAGAPTLLFCIFIFIIMISCPMLYSMSDAEALLNLKSSLTNSNALNNWVPKSVPCGKEDQWVGVICSNGFVTGLRLEGMGLSGKIEIDPLLEIRGLRIISIMNNSFSNAIPEFNRIGFLKAMYLSRNQFSGEIPSDYFQTMGSLKKLWLSDNKLTGLIPSSLTQTPLVELHLENNQFSGNIPNLSIQLLAEFNVANNKLEGQIPSSLLKFKESSFAGNSGLCGEKLGKVCENAVHENIKNNAALSNSNTGTGSNSNSSKSGSVLISVIVATSVLLIALVLSFVVRSRRKKEDFYSFGREITKDAVQVQVFAPARKEVEPIKKTISSSSKRASSRGRGGAGGIGALVVVNDEKGLFGLVDLMKASAELLGNGGLGSSYKAVMANGVAVVVKRTREMNALEKDEFHAEMRKLGKLKHWNILTPLAYHYRKEEKLVVFEFVPKGSLLYMLHGDRGPSHAELDWPARLKIVQGIAKGMHYLQTELASSDLPHGNLKSSNILLGPDYEPLLVDYGFSSFINSANLTQTLCAYRAPEAVHGQVSPKCDVYCLGVVILEILTGKFPSQYLNNGKGGTDVVQWAASAISEGRESELLDPGIAGSKNSLGEMVQLLHIGAACTASNPVQRLDLTQAIRSIEEIQTEEA